MPFTDTRAHPSITGNPMVEETLAMLRAFDGSRVLVNVEIEIPVGPQGTPNAARWAGAMQALFPITSMGIFADRNVAGTETVSQHAYGNAVDTFASWPVMDQIFNFGVANAALFSIRLLILRDVQWYGGIGHYGGIYHNHVHADFWPQYPL